MKFWTKCIAAAGLIALVGAPGFADVDVDKIVDKAIKAHGGKEALEKTKGQGAHIKGKMKVESLGGVEASLESQVFKGKFRQDIQLTVMGQDVQQTVGFDKKELWISVNGKIVMTVSGADELKPYMEALHMEEAAGLVLQKDKSIEVSIIGESMLNDKPVVGLRVTKKGYKDVSLYFDKESGLLTKIEGRGVDGQSQMEVSKERIIHEYKMIDGTMRPVRASIIDDGKKAAEIEFTEQKFVDSIDDSVFKKPS